MEIEGSYLTSQAEFRPELLSRRGEIFAWIAALIANIAWGIYLFSGMQAFFLVPLLAILLVISALMISLSNWMDRRTVLRLNNDGVSFDNGLRRVTFTWNEIQNIEVFHSHLGDKVRVQGEKVFFDFRTLSEIKLRGEIKGRLGFSQGELILNTIVEKAELQRVEKSGDSYYYARE
jgi:hypothetical protein